MSMRRRWSVSGLTRAAGAMSALPSALRLTCCCCWLLLTCLVVFLIPASCTSDTPRQVIRRTRERPGGDDDALARGITSYLDDAEYDGQISSDNDDYDDDDLEEDWFDKNITAAKRLGEQCFYRATCTFADQHSTCIQVQHNAVCDCEEGYHRVALSRPNKKVFCAEDLVLITTDLPTLLCIASGIAIFTGMICFVLKLFSRARYSRPRHYANANHAPPMLFSSDTGIPLTLHGRPSSRSSQRSNSAGPLSCAFTRRPSSGGSRGPLVPASRAGAARAAAILLISCHLQATKGNNKHRRTLSDVAEGSSDGLGSRRPSLASVHSSTSSSRSYSARRLEKERNDKEQRQVLQELRLAKQRDQLQQQQQQVVPTPSPRTPHSTDELLPAVEEGKEVFYNDQVPTTSDVSDTIPTMTTTMTTTITTSSVITTRMGEIAPMTTPTTPVFGTSVAPRASDDIFQV
ncbi:uncharacterized protein LOC114932527 isoform X3 [Nylanderia fulva]|uniref:uncharacterized protein LOC114932527 isoform X3 n=1 Tax=Nylanderia fulva TaxID=613905 RepID=UPI0010FAF592|nr:uncharacterized protein LOC114932527 isoform X3 [Nylanderia fulva]